MPSGAPRRLSLSGAGRLLAGLAVGLAVGALLVALRGTDLVEGFELGLLDVRIRGAAGEQGPDPRIVLAQVQDDDALVLKRERALTWPWPLEVDAQIFRLLGAAGVHAVLLDVFHADAGATPEDVPNEREFTDLERQSLEGEAEIADGYAAALVALRRTVTVVPLTDRPMYDVPSRRKAAEPRLDPAGLTAPPGAHARRALDLPVSRVGGSVARLGFGNVVPDADGVVRRAAVLARAGDRTVLSAALATALVVDGGSARLVPGGLELGGRLLPLNDDATFLVGFRSKGRGAYPRVAPAQLWAWADQLARAPDGAVPPDARAALEGKIVVWGINLTAQEDLTATPLDRAYDGPELQATILDDLLNGGGRVRATRRGNALWLLGLCGLAGLVTLGTKHKVLPYLFTLLLAAVTVAVAFLVFARGTALDLFTPLVGLVLTLGGTTTLRLLTEGRYNKWLEGTFSRYLAPSVIDALKQNPRLLELGGVEREVTVLFSDIAGFTGLSERLGPTQLVALLNRYLTVHCDAVFAHGGVVDKFIGDAVMAFYGDPVPQPDHALRACRTALDVRAALPALEPVWRGMNLPHFDMRIGLNSGPAVLGNMGSDQRFSYTAMGDTVNLASRLEGANKAFGTYILLGAATYEAAKDGVLARPIGRLGVVGKSDAPAPVYELIALRERATPEQVRLVEAFARAQAAARAGDLPVARAALAEAEASRPGDGPCAWFGGLLDRLASGAEPSPWSGVVVLGSK